MEYHPYDAGGNKDVLLLAEGRHLGYHWVVLSYSTHPCCYVQITNPEHPYYHAQYDDIELKTSGIISYSRRYLKIPDENDPPTITQNNEGWWIGWDYMRTGFYDYNDDKLEESKTFHKWTSQELVDECYSVIYQLASKIKWTDIFNRWTEPDEYLKNKELGRIEFKK